MGEHSPVGASSAARWMQCPGSINLARQAPPSKSSIFAAMGTAAHEVVEKCFPNGDPFEFVGEKMSNHITICQMDAEAVHQAIEAIKEDIPDLEENWNIRLEQRVHLNEIHEDLFGTADIVLESKDGKKLKVIDYKHGQGVKVEVENNTQLKYYALGVILEYCREKMGVFKLEQALDEFEEVEVAVAQPRCDHEDGPYRTWIFDREEMENFTLELGMAVIATEQKDAFLCSGDHCRWCPALALCPQISNDAAEIAKTDFMAVSDPVNLNLPTAGALVPAEVSKILRFKPILLSWFQAIEDYASHLLHEGEEVPDYKLVKRKANRKWMDEEEALSALSMLFDADELFTKKIKSPAQVEKLLGSKNKKAIADYVFTPDSGLTVAHESDRRKAVQPHPENDFEIVE